MRLLETEVLIVGGGLAGLRAAIESSKRGMKTILPHQCPNCPNFE